MGTLKVCKKCMAYTLKVECPACGSPTSNPHPPRFSPQDTYGRYRRRLKLEMYRRNKLGRL